MIYAALLLILIVGAILLFTFRNSGVGLAASGYTYLKYNDGVYVGVEKTEVGDVKAEVTVKNNRIKNIKLVEIPSEYISQNSEVEDEISGMIYDTIKTQDVSAKSGGGSKSYVLSKVVKAVRNALNQSLIKQ